LLGQVLENEPIRRTDVVHADDYVEDRGDVQSGITRSLLSQWNSKGAEESWVDRKPIILNEAEGKVAESEPSRHRDDVAREDLDSVDTEQIMRGTTKSLRCQWQCKASEEFKANRRPIVLAEAEGTVSENQPEAPRSDITRETDAEPEGDQVQKGTTRSLLSQWKSKGSEEFRAEKRPIVLAEGDDCVAENDPIQRSDVVHGYTAVDDATVERGTTKSMLTQWKSKGSEPFKAERKQIVIAEDEGRVSESEPVRREGIVRATDEAASEADMQMKGYTKSMLMQWKNKPNEEVRIEKRKIVMAEDEGAVAESTPTVREDVVRGGHDVELANEQVQKGFTRDLRAQWMTKGSEKFERERQPIVVAEGEGTVSENEPVRRSDVVHCDDLEPGDEVQSGITSSLRAQWLTKGSEQFQKERKTIVIAEDEGSVAENEPVTRSDVVHSDDRNSGDQIQRGMTKNLRAQWLSKGSEEPRTASQRLPIVVAEGEGTVAENEPLRRSDVVHSDDVDASEQVQKGMTRTIRAQWMTKGSDEYRVDRSPIVVAEDEGSVSENAPVRRSDVVHHDDVETTEQVQRGITKSLKDQWMTKGTVEYQSERKPIVIAEGEGTVAENQPVARSDVVHCEFVDDKNQVQTGITKNLRDQWITKGTQEYQSSRPPIVVAEGEGTVAENEPVRRSDVVHSGDLETDGEQVQRGITQNLRAQWMTKGSEQYQPTRQPIVVAEGEGKVAENEPVRRSDVIHSDDICEEGEFVQRGTTKTLLNRWSSSVPHQPATSSRRPIVVAEDEGRVLESEPTRRADVVHADDVTDPDAEMVQKGTTKSLLSQWKVKGSEEFKSERKVINIAEAEGKIAESQPVRRSDVVHADDVSEEADQRVERGMARSLMTQWSQKSNEEFRVERKPIVLAEAEGKIVESEPIRRDDVVHHDDLDTSGDSVSKGMTKNLLSQWTVKGSEQFMAERQPIILAEAEGKIAENEPEVRSDVVRADDWHVEGEQIQRGMAKSLVNQWKTKGQEEFRVERKPIIVAEVEGQVLENEPEVRTDVVRSDEIQTEGESIRRGTTRSLLTQLKTKAAEEYKPQRKSIIIQDKLPTS